MGIVYNSTSRKDYISSEVCDPGISHRRAIKALTRQNIQFLRKIGLRVRSGGK